LLTRLELPLCADGSVDKPKFNKGVVEYSALGLHAFIMPALEKSNLETLFGGVPLHCRVLCDPLHTVRCACCRSL
jgi:hypothetical protein